jgi:hypothetical protein
MDPAGWARQVYPGLASLRSSPRHGAPFVGLMDRAEGSSCLVINIVVDSLIGLVAGRPCTSIRRRWRDLLSWHFGIPRRANGDLRILVYRQS